MQHFIFICFVSFQHVHTLPVRVRLGLAHHGSRPRYRTWQWTTMQHQLWCCSLPAGYVIVTNEIATAWLFVWRCRCVLAGRETVERLNLLGR
ncbi:hypothetical protein CCHOA_04595 [Corynebacterium choanae]|uniref:Uncharacterized protein n=1 Tax=Corynebacterium choanae TaxID=1862358 RepID=A0A3G6J5K3_9CORY|nr:hypothetical protein CCHOA_04595 [Corynebacterium choanae]